MTAPWVIPISVLAAVVVIGLVFIWFWFPRAWTKGIRSDHAELDQLGAPEREAQRAVNRAVIERFKRNVAMERGEVSGQPEYAPPPPYIQARGPKSDATVRLS